MQKVFVGTGQLFNINHSFGNVDFSAENQFIMSDLSSDVIINVSSSILNAKLGTFDTIWDNSTISLNLNEIKSLIKETTDIHSIGNMNTVNSQYKTYVENTFFRPESLYNDEKWIQDFDTTFDKTTFLSLVANANQGSFILKNTNSLFELWRNSTNNDNNYSMNDGFIDGHYIYFPNGISLNYSNDFRDNTSQTQLGSISFYKYYNIVFKII